MDEKKPECACISPEAMAGLLIRVALGMLFFVAGLGKFMAPGGAAGVSQGIIEQFADTGLPKFLVAPYAYGLPYVEFSLGILLLLGLYTKEALVVTGFLLISLAFGMAVKQQPVVADILNYVLMAAIGLWFAARDNRYSLDRVLRKK